MLKVRGSTSTKTGEAPASTATSAVAVKVNAGRKTASPRPMPSAIQGHEQRVGSAGHADRVRRAGEGLERALQLGDLRTVDELAVVEHGLDARVDLRPQLAVLGREVDERDCPPFRAQAPLRLACASTHAARAASRSA